MSYRLTWRMLRRKQTHRLLLLRSAIGLFGQHGYHPVTVRRIVKNARSSNGSFYFYFGSKEDIFVAALQRFAETMADVLHAAIAAAPTDPLQQIRAAVEHLVLLLADSPNEARILIVESAGLGARLGKIRRDILESNPRFFEQLLARSAPVPSASTVAARCCVGCIYESIYHWLGLPLEQRLTPSDLASAVADFAVRGIRASQASPLPEKEA